MGLEAEKSIKVKGVVDFEWRLFGDVDGEAPDKAKNAGDEKNVGDTDNALVYWTPEIANQPARVTSMNFRSHPSEILFNVSKVCSSCGDVVLIIADNVIFVSAKSFGQQCHGRLGLGPWPKRSRRNRESHIMMPWSMGCACYVNLGPGKEINICTSKCMFKCAEQDGSLIARAPLLNRSPWSMA